MDYPVKALSDAEIKELAHRLLRHFEVSNREWVDVVGLLERGSVWTLRGEKRLVYDVRPDSEMGDDDATTAYAKSAITIAVKQSVHDKARVGEGRARMTLAHELGHAVMHQGAPKARRSGQVGAIQSKWLKPFESAEHQAKVFGAAFLVSDDVAESLPGPEEIAVHFGVSFQCAKIKAEEITARRERAASVERVMQKAQAFFVQLDAETAQRRYLNEICVTCGRQTLYPMGGKYMCENCGIAMDRFQDGDPCAS